MLAEFENDFSMTTETSDIDWGVAHLGDAHDSASLKEELNHHSVTLVTCPMERGHAQLRCCKVDICFTFEQDSNALHAFRHNESWIFGGRDALSSIVAFVADKIEGRQALMIRCVNIKRNVFFLPLRDNPSQTGWVSVQGCLVNRQVAIFICSVKNLV